VRDALRRSDRYAATTYRWSANVAWLAADDLERARAELAAGVWSPPEEGLHLQHWFHTRARTELALYAGDAAAIAACADELRRFQRGGALDHVEIVRAETAIEVGRIAILQGNSREIRDAFATLRRERSGYFRTIALHFEAAAQALEGRADAARTTLFKLVGRAEGAGLPVLAALARRRAGEMTTGTEAARLIADTDVALRRYGVMAPDRFARAFLTWPSDMDSVKR